MTNPEYTYGAPARNRAPSSDWHWIDYAAVLVDRMWIAIVVLVLAVGIGVYRTWKQIPMYRASARIMVEENLPKLLNVEDVLMANARNLQYFNTHVLALNSRSMAEQAMVRSGLDRDPGFLPTNGAVSARATAALAFLRVSPVPQSRLIDVAVEHPDPVMAAAFANAIAEQYIEVNLNRRSEVSTESFEWLKQQADEYHAKIEKGYAAIHDYREKLNVASLEENENVVVGKLKAISQDLLAADSQYMALDAEWKEVQAAREAGRPLSELACLARDEGVQSAFAALQRQQGEVKTLENRYRTKHPALTAALNLQNDLAAQYEAACQEAVKRLESRYRMAGDKVASFREALDAQGKVAMELDRKLIRYKELKRELEADRQMYDVIAARMKEAKFVGEVKQSNIRLVDRAEPASRPFRPVWKKAVLTSILLGLLLGVGLSYASYFLDDRMKRVEDVEHTLGMPVMAVVPPVMLPGASDRSRVVERSPFAPAAEAFRSLRASLALRQEWPGCRRLMVTSTTAGEGKSTVACNLSMVLAQSGQRTLLIDADMRRPVMRDVFGMESAVGLSELLAGNGILDEAVVATAIPNLSVMGAGRLPSNPSEMLASPAMRDLLETLEKRFDRIVMDCPPVFGVSDPISLLPSMHCVIFVLHHGKTGSRAAIRAMNKIREGGAAFVGLVFNNVALKLSSGYYYYYQYHKYGDDKARRGRGEPAEKG